MKSLIFVGIYSACFNNQNLYLNTEKFIAVLATVL